MAVEARRGCGYRKAGGLYLVTKEGIGEPCERLPIPLSECPCCRRPPVRLSRGVQRVGSQYVFGAALPCHKGDQAAKDAGHHGRCILCNEGLLLSVGDPRDQFFLVTVGKQHYATPREWTAEANALGVSRRIAAIPKGLVLGKSWVLVAHPEACESRHIERHDGELGEVEVVKRVPGIFHAFRPQAIELVVTPSMEKEEWVERLQEKGVTLVRVPEDDPDHASGVGRKSERVRAMERHSGKFGHALERRG